MAQADRDHARRDICEHQMAAALLHEERVVAAAGAELEQRLDLAVALLLEKLGVDTRFFLVLLGRRHELPPRRELAVEQR